MIAYALSTHDRSLSDAGRPPEVKLAAIDGRATLTIQRSRLVMNTARTTTTVAMRARFDFRTEVVTT